MEPLNKNLLKNRQIVKLYYNLHKKCLSIKDKKSGIIVAHLENVLISNAKFKVSEKGRQRVLREKQKNVHAYIEGEVRLDDVFDLRKTENVGIAYYNPYLTETFIDNSTEEPLYYSSLVYCHGKTIYYAKNLNNLEIQMRLGNYVV